MYFSPFLYQPPFLGRSFELLILRNQFFEYQSVIRRIEQIFNSKLLYRRHASGARTSHAVFPRFAFSEYVEVNSACVDTQTVNLAERRYFCVELCGYVLLSTKVPEPIVVVLHGVGALLRESGSNYFVADDRNTANLSAFEVRHFCHVPRIAKEFAVFGGERKTRN